MHSALAPVQREPHGAYLYARSLCGPTRTVFDVVRPADVPNAYRVGYLRCFAFALNPAVAGNPYSILARFAYNAWQAANICSDRGWYYVRTI